MERMEFFIESNPDHSESRATSQIMAMEEMDIDGGDLPRCIKKMHLQAVDADVFGESLRCGQPLVVEGVDRDQFALPWSPIYFITHHGDQSCTVLGLEGDKEISVKEFFETFGKYSNRKAYWKLKVSRQLRTY